MGGSEEDDSFIPRRKPMDRKPQDDIRISIPAGPVTRFLKDKAAWLLMVVTLWGGTDMWAKVTAKNSATEAATAASETKELVESNTDKLAHKLDNGLADRIAAKVNKNTTEQIAPIKKRLDAIERFLTGDEAAIEPIRPDASTLAKPE